MRKQVPPRVNWCFTDFCQPRITEDVPGIAPDQVRYLVAQKEICPDTGREHWQGYVQLNAKQRLSTVRNLLPGAHWEPAKGTPNENIAYCTKEETRKPGTEPVFYGEPINKGKRNDLASLRDSVKAGKKFKELVEDDALLPVVARHMPFYRNLRSLIMPPANPKREFILLYGKPGAGKTRFVFDNFGKTEDLFVTPLSNGTFWFDGYDGHRFFLIDDFDGAASGVKLNDILRLLDIYSVQIPVKGGHVWYAPEKVFVSSNLKPSDWYNFKGREVKFEAIMRRWTEAHVWDENGIYSYLKTNAEVCDYFPYEERAFDSRIRLGESIRD